ncbi:hypothetical protein [Aureimonas ureilytica]|uniref:hypothetical protein n=1 Tax=Aureimonas ureilytica TaxID=401562 RepID=UPI00037E9095|nr:hypothetical protein [Aureimonas ureilytica]
MADVIPFVPKAHLAALANMEEFVRFCREELTVFGADLEFTSSSWNVTKSYHIRGKSHKHILNFTMNAPRRGQLGAAMPEPFAGQVKAYIRYQVGRGPAKAPPQNEILAFRALLAAFLDKAVAPDLGSVDAHLLDHAVQLAAARRPGNHAASIGVLLTPISQFLRENNLAANAPIDWKHGQEWELYNKRSRDERRAALMPSDEALQALPRSFRKATEPRDVIATSVMALLACAPSRINELFALHHDCEIKPLTDGDEGYMLRWAGSKGHHDFVKGIPAVMADVAREALARLKKHTAEARRIAAWYEHHPDRLYLPDDCVHLRGKDLSGADIARIIGFNEAANGRDWAIDRKLKPIEGMRSSGGRRIFAFRFSDVESAILSELPHGFPIFDKQTGLRYSEALMLVRRQEFADRGRGRWRCMVAPVSYGNIMHSFHRPDGVFARLGLSTPEHPIVLKTHQLRHWLNTLAQRGGLTEAETAAWSGRLDPRQNEPYDHRTPEEMLQAMRRRDKEVATIKGTAVSVNPPVARNEAAARAVHGHATDIGFCGHDFASSPCMMFMQCLHCTKHTCVKGHDPRHLERVELGLERARQSLVEAEVALAKEYEGADDWVRAHRETIERLEQLHGILSDPTVPDGSVIRLAKSGRYSLVEQAMRDNEVVTGVLLPRNVDGMRGIGAGTAGA